MGMVVLTGVVLAPTSVPRERKTVKRERIMVVVSTDSNLFAMIL
jgi:hypothetical protein